MYYNLSVRTERLFYKALNVYKYYYCDIASDLILVELRPTGVYRSCDKCKACKIKIEPSGCAEEYNLESVNSTC